MKKKTKGSTAMLRVAFYGGAPVNAMAARVAGVTPAGSHARDLRRKAKKAKTVELKETLQRQVASVEKRNDKRLVSRAALERARKALEKAKWQSEQRDLERTAFKDTGKVDR